MRRLRVTLAYDGTEFHGWQVQPGQLTIQGILEEIVSGIEKRPVHVAGSGRTDAGVHALAQVCAFSLENPIPPVNLKRAMNRLLPTAIRVLEVEEAHSSFHPRFDAIAKTYEYRFYRGEICPPHERLYVHHHPYPLDWDRAGEAACLFAGEHDLSAFAAADERDDAGRSKVRTIYQAELRQEQERAYFRVRGSGFLKHMVRNLAGTLIEAGRGNVTLEQLREMLGGVYAKKGGPTAPACGLFLMSVEYPDTKKEGVIWCE